MRDFHISQRPAGRLVRVDPKSVRRHPTPDTSKIRKEMQKIAAKRRRLGYRRIRVMLVPHLAVNDHCSRENLCLVADTLISVARVGRELDALARVYGKR